MAALRKWDQLDVFLVFLILKPVLMNSMQKMWSNGIQYAYVKILQSEGPHFIKETPTQVFSFENCQVFKNTYFKNICERLLLLFEDYYLDDYYFSTQ